MPSCTYRVLTRKLRKQGWRFWREADGSHEIWTNSSGKKLTIPRHSGDLPVGTLNQIVKRAGFAHIQAFLESR